MPITDYRYAAPTAAPRTIAPAQFESLARAKAQEWPSTIAANMLCLYFVEGCDETLFNAGKTAAGKLRRGGLTNDDRLAIGRAIVDHHLAQQHRKGLVVYLREPVSNG